MDIRGREKGTGCGGGEKESEGSLNPITALSPVTHGSKQVYSSRLLSDRPRYHPIPRLTARLAVAPVARLAVASC